MPVIGFNFDKFHVEKKKQLEAPIKVDSSMKIVDIKKEGLRMGEEDTEKILKVDYEFGIKYDPKQAEILIEGHLLYHEDEKKLDKILSEWKKTKKFDAEMTQLIMNNILLRCNIKALLLGQEIGLPPHIRMPMIQPGKPESQKKAEEYIG
ncbi:MAG: hypothetical protein ABIJ18_04990 [archaeon]